MPITKSRTSKNSNKSNIKTNTTMQTPIAASKRGREPQQNSLFDAVLKTPRLSHNDSPFKMLNIVDNRFEKLTEVMKTIIKESEQRVLNEFDKRFGELKRDISNITERVNKLETVVDDIISLKNEVNNLKTQLQRQENSLVASDLRINGVPYKDGEDLYNILNSICCLLKINTPAVKSIYRLQNYNNKGNGYSPHAVIMVKLLSPYDKNFVLKSIATFRKNNKCSLLLNHIGIDSDRPFYVNENLTMNNYKILQSAVKYKNSNRLKSVFTMRGIVYIKFNLKDEPIRVESIEELDGFFRDQNQSYREEQTNYENEAHYVQ